MECVICNHKNRKEIEQELLLRNFGDSDATFKSIADKYNVPINDLKIHALMHMSLDYEDSIVDKIKMREAGVLQDTIADEVTTMKNLGCKINKIINEHTTDSPTLNQIPKQIVDLYLGCAQQINTHIDSLVKMNISINGTQNEGLSALKGLVEVISGQKNGD